METARILKVPSLSANHSPFSVWLVNGYRIFTLGKVLRRSICYL